MTDATPADRPPSEPSLSSEAQEPPAPVPEDVPGAGDPAASNGAGAADPSPGESAPEVPDPDAAAGPGQDREMALQTELERVQDQRMRLAADFDNHRKRSEERLRASWARAQADLLARLLDPLDDLRRVAECDPEAATATSLVEGVVLVERKFARLLDEAGVEVVDPQDEPFDPATMEAMMRVPAETEELDDMVERVLQRGFTLKGQLLRPARVAVYKAG